MNKQLFQYHPTIGYTYIPSITARVIHESGGYLVKVNNLGFRCNHDVKLEKDPKKLRIIVFGDSYTAGDGVSNKYRYTDVLEKMIVNTEVLNFGLPGTGLDQQYLVFREFAKDLDYDLTIISIFVENITRVISKYKLYSTLFGEPRIMAKPYFTIDENKSLLLHNIPVHKDPILPENLDNNEKKYVHGFGWKGNIKTIIEGIGGKNLVEIFQRITKFHHYPQYDSSNSEAWLLLKSILLKWIGEIKTKTILLIIPSHYHYDEVDTPIKYQKRFNELLNINDVIICDPLNEYLRIQKEKRKNLRFKKDVHPTKFQHEILAKVLKNSIFNNKLI